MTHRVRHVTDARARLADARLYVCTDARTSRGDLPQFVEQIVRAGADIVQLRDKKLSAREELDALSTVADVCERFGALWAVNDRVDLALAVGAPIVHLGQDDFPVAKARMLVGPDVLIGQSTHSIAQASAAAIDPEVDYYAVGPLWSTPTKPGRPAVGLELAHQVAQERSAQEPGQKPWFAIGGIDLTTIDQVAAAGAQRVVVVRAVTEASDPAAAAAALRARVAAGTMHAQAVSQ
ncbi:MAG: thiamine phosphate synthase [Actinobacteria bacterium]|nr:thiamine phosphate synthase [Actinomycetota bacterium]